MPLVSDCGVIETVTQNDLVGGKGRADDFTNKLSAAGVHQKQLGFVVHSAVLDAVLESVANFFSDRSSSRLTQRPDLVAELAQSCGEQRYLSGLAAPFSTLEGNE